jgi:leader peptidase (prepilin peptidase)/N-methyltransferase
MQTILLLTLLYFLFGAIIGSFLGVCAYRIPMGKYEPIHDGVKEIGRSLSLISPARSFCPQCEKQLEWWHTIPVVSWLLLRGRCAHCSARIPFRYLVIELLTGTMCAVNFLRFGPSITGLCAFAFICLFIVITYIDLDYMIIPDVITYPATFIGIAIGIANGYLSGSHGVLLEAPFVRNPFQSIGGLLMGPGLLIAVWWLYFKIRKREGLGLGDVKLLAVCGAAFGMECSWFTIFFGSVLGSVLGITMLLVRRSSLSSYIPFGPYLAVAAVAYILDVPTLIVRLINPSLPITWWISSQL